MLLSLHIKNYVIIDELILDFQSGMTVISGETGAGKSIMIDALSLVMGARAETHVIKHGQTRCEITAVFDVSQNSAAKNWLCEQDLLHDDNAQECIFRRVVTQDGRSRSTLNGQMFPVQKTRELGLYLVDIHGQHEHQLLLKSETHRIQLDDYAHHADLVNHVVAHYKAWQALRAEIDQISVTHLEAQTARKTLISYQLEELQQADIAADEAEKLHQEYTLLSQADACLNHAQGIAAILSEDEGVSLKTLLQSALNLLPSSALLATSPAWHNVQTLLHNAQIQCEEAETEIKHLLHTIEPNPERLQQIDQRMQQLHALARKHHTTMDALPTLQQALSDELALLETQDERKSILLAQLADIEQQYHIYAQQLSHSRQQYAVQLGDAITAFIHTLGMPHGRLNVQIDSQPSMHIYGYDKVEYYIMTNPSQPPRPLAKVASGGELSRISLAIEVVTTQKNQDLTRLFDEVDVGIGGQTAAVVGKLLRTLGEKSQVLCITHQPQTAAQGHQHLYVEKQVIHENDRDVAHFQVYPLVSDARVKEIARMLGGLTITPHTLAHATELLDSF